MTEKQGRYIAQKMEEWEALRRSYRDAKEQLEALLVPSESTTGNRGFVGFTNNWGPGGAVRMNWNREGVSISGLATLAEVDFSTLRAFTLEALERRVSETKAAMEAFKLEVPEEEGDWKPGDRLRSKADHKQVLIYQGEGQCGEGLFFAYDTGGDCYSDGWIRADFEKVLEGAE